MALTSISEYKTYAGISGTSEDTRLTALLAVAEDIVKKIGGREFESATYTETHDGDGAAAIILTERPVASITSVVYVSPDGDTSAIESDTYALNAKAGTLRRVGYQHGPSFTSMPVSAPGYGPVNCWPIGKQNIRVVYSGGYTTIPQGLRLAVWRVIDYLRSDAGRNPQMASESLGPYSYSRLQADPNGPFVEVAQLVGMYA